MKVSVSKQIFEKFPKMVLGMVVAKGINNKGSDDKMYHLLDEIENLIRMDFTPENIAEHYLISPWRTAYEEFGSKATHYNSSVESLMKNILKGRKTARINKAVEISNYLSLKHLVPTGVNDLDKIQGNVLLTFAKGNETFVPLGISTKENPDKGEVIYKDSKEVLCRRWNWKDSDKAKVTEETKDVIFYIDALPPVNKTKLKEILKDVIDLLDIFCSPKEKAIYVIDKLNPEVNFK